MVGINSILKSVKSGIKTVTNCCAPRRLTKLERETRNFELNSKAGLKELPFYQPLLDRAVILIIKIVKKTPFSTDSSIAKIEEELNAKGIFIRCKDVETAEYFKKGLLNIEKAGFDYPKNILFLPYKGMNGKIAASWHLGKKFASEAPIIFRDDFMTYPKWELKIAGYTSSQNPHHHLYHETGHWLFQQIRPTSKECNCIIKNANWDIIKQEVSEYAGDSKNADELVAEVFAGMMDGKKYSDYVMNIYKQLQGPMPKPAISLVG